MRRKVTGATHNDCLARPLHASTKGNNVSLCIKSFHSIQTPLPKYWSICRNRMNPPLNKKPLLEFVFHFFWNKDGKDLPPTHLYSLYTEKFRCWIFIRCFSHYQFIRKIGYHVSFQRPQDSKIKIMQQRRHGREVHSLHLLSGSGQCFTRFKRTVFKRKGTLQQVYLCLGLHFLSLTSDLGLFLHYQFLPFNFKLIYLSHHFFQCLAFFIF